MIPLYCLVLIFVIVLFLLIFANLDFKFTKINTVSCYNFDIEKIINNGNK